MVSYRSEVVSICRALFRARRHQYPHYNLREYTKRRTLDGFRMNKKLTDQSKVNEAYAEAKAQLVVLERSVKLYSLYPPKTKNIMEF
ncbi:PREDICTED: LYR motif-containing protein 4-like [Camelina sativa]|uniref:LYR motif-containing protein 4-like n=1 Tax=Camelina sativa TaxID=90675 RepID=A0ABM1R6G7_CAMSA|nr:PREDICTED: LYR motif-containing protein 4-like [Camelina sativa]